MKRFLIILAILTIAASASAAPPPFAIINPAQDSRIGTLTNTKWCYSDGSQVLCTQDALAGAGDFLADGTVPMTGAIIPDSAGGQTIGTTSAEFGHIYLHNSKSIYFQADQSVYLTGGAGALSLTGGNFTPGASTLTLGSTAAEWGGLYLGDGKIIYGQADQSNTITSSATGWVFNLPITTQSAKLTGGTNTFNLTNGTASLDVAAGATLNIDTSLQVATGAVVLNGNAGGSSSLTLGNFALSLGGTMADGRLCTYASSGTAISCNTATSTFQTADADLTTFAGLTATRGDILYVGEAGTWADLAKGSANTVLYSDGTDVKYGSVTSAMITDNTITATDLAATLTFADGDFVDLSGVTMSGTNDEGITLPFWADVTPTSGATKRFMTWDESGSVLKIYTASGWTTINPSAGAPTDVAYLVTGSLSGSLSAERLLAEGTGIDFTDAGANGNFTIAVDTTEIGTTTWGAGSEVVWTFNASGGTDPTITFGDATVTFAGTVSATAFSGNITGNVTGNCSGSAGTVTDTELAAIQGLTFADASIIQLTGAGAAAVLTSGGNNYILGSNSDNSALEFKTPANVLSQIGAQPLDGDLTAIAALSVARGSLITGQGGTPAWAALTIGTSGYYLRSDGTDAAWAAIAAGDLPSNSDSSAGVVASGSGQNAKVWKTDASGVPGWRDDATGGSPTFDLVAAGTNTTAAMVLGAGSSLAVTGGTFKIVETGGSPTYHATIQGGDQADNITITLPGATSTLVGEGVATGGLLLGDSTPDTAGEIGYASNNLSFHDGTASRTVAALEKAQTFTANNTFGDADTDTLTLRSLLIGGNSRAVWIAGSAPTPTYATGTNELYVGGDVESGGNVYAANFVSTGTGESYATFANNASTPEATITNGIYFVGNVLKVKENGTERDVVTPADSVTWTGTTHSFTGALTVGETNGLLIGATGVKITSDNDGAITFTGNSAGYDEDLTINLDDTENTAVFSSSTGVTKLDFSALNLATTGIITGAVNTNSDANGMSSAEMTTAGMYGTMFWATGAGTWALPGAATGMNFCVYSTTAAAIVINPDDGDTIVLNGTALSAGDSITSASGAGDFICLLAKDANTWYTLGRSGAWTDTN